MGVTFLSGKLSTVPAVVRVASSVGPVVETSHWCAVGWVGSGSGDAKSVVVRVALSGRSAALVPVAVRSPGVARVSVMR